MGVVSAICADAHDGYALAKEYCNEKAVRNPVCTHEGHLFDMEAVVPYVKEHQINPVTGKPLLLKELVQLHFSKNSQEEYICPVTYKVFTDNTKIAAIATTGNVFCHAGNALVQMGRPMWYSIFSV
ncbi:unnamed protein product [Peronospora destructor]|uniref:U-box domain-containing protein n=1 Tax=Peronospora destructor TaxID=86335 RepID=A0AAV0URY1_9STRA|nr:unnamed protein product [Peronospora destructor]